jgi:hypothetical protein
MKLGERLLLMMGMGETREERLDRIAGELATSLPFSKATMRLAIEAYGEQGARPAAEIAAATGGEWWPPTLRDYEDHLARRARAAAYLR